MIITGGENVYSVEVENVVVEASGDRRRARSSACPTSSGASACTPSSCCSPSRPLALEELQTLAREQIAGYKIPRSLSFVDALPLSAQGKVLKRDLRVQRVRAVAGSVKLNTVTVGNGSRTAALVHGASMSTEAWKYFVPYLLEHDLTLILVDQRGHGDSPRADSYRIEDFADDLVETLPTGLDFLIGQSLGGLTAAWAAERLRPKRYIGARPCAAMTPAPVHG